MAAYWEGEWECVCVCVCVRERERERDRFVLRIDVIEWLETNEADVSGRTTDGGWKEGKNRRRKRTAKTNKQTNKKERKGNRKKFKKGNLVKELIDWPSVLDKTDHLNKKYFLQMDVQDASRCIEREREEIGSRIEASGSLTIEAGLGAKCLWWMTVKCKQIRCY